MWLAILAGPLPHDGGVAVLARTQVAALPEHASEVLDDHRRCYPPVDGSTVLEPLYPDRLAEDFLALTTPGNSDPGADREAVDSWAATSLLSSPVGQDSPSWARGALSVLIETAHRWPHIAATQLAPLLTTRPELILHAGGTVLARLAALPDIDTALLEKIEALLPASRHIDLDLGIAALSARLVERRLKASSGPCTSRTDTSPSFPPGPSDSPCPFGSPSQLVIASSSMQALTWPTRTQNPPISITERPIGEAKRAPLLTAGRRR
ncbi:hypothetical protein GCM10009555_064340 [Acrocarpospora macrocephala]|uniref:Uncharacterized protein n=1 Tax=Acrocarpospora macrocephala TaxID=150177 RepID=A0A5M3WKA8_9ACTN|nr:hypothetical protein [Acrocarpospora macrocephala]GES07631.1 hypothetical protein Amac_012260 [Acrocarpospora macrocephala]